MIINLYVLDLFLCLAHFFDNENISHHIVDYVLQMHAFVHLFGVKPAGCQDVLKEKSLAL